jgi:DNA sulfur modification protein DndC
MLLDAQSYIRKHGPSEVADIKLISLDELAEIRRIWVVDKHELEDSLPRIYEEATGEKLPGESMDEDVVLRAAEMNHLRQLCGDDRLHYELTRELLSLTRQQRNAARRSGLFEQLEKSFSKHFYDNAEDAIARATAAAEAKKALADRRRRGADPTLFDDGEDRI